MKSYMEYELTVFDVLPRISSHELKQEWPESGSRLPPRFINRRYKVYQKQHDIHSKRSNHNGFFSIEHPITISVSHHFTSNAKA